MSSHDHLSCIHFRESHCNWRFSDCNLLGLIKLQQKGGKARGKSGSLIGLLSTQLIRVWFLGSSDNKVIFVIFLVLVWMACLWCTEKIISWDAHILARTPWISCQFDNSFMEHLISLGHMQQIGLIGTLSIEKCLKSTNPSPQPHHHNSTIAFQLKVRIDK